MAYQDLDFARGYGVCSWENNGLTFVHEDLVGVSLPHNYLVIITAGFGECFVSRFVVD